MNPTQVQFLRAVALRQPYQFGETGDVNAGSAAAVVAPTVAVFAVGVGLTALVGYGLWKAVIR